MSTRPSSRHLKGRIRSRALGGTAALALITAVLVGGGLVVGGTASPGNAQQTATEIQIITPATFTKLANKVKPAVVSIQVSSPKASEPGSQSKRSEGPGVVPGMPRGGPSEEFFKRFFGEPDFRDRFERRFGQRGERRDPHPKGQSVGSGFIISADGYVVTNNHVIAGGGDVTVVLDDGTKLDAKLIGTDKRTDLAVLKIEGNDLPFVTWTKAEPQVGEWIMAVGNPFGLGGTVTTGIISASGRAIGSGPYDDYIQIDASVNRGNSGGPTFNLAGEVIGVNTAIFSPNGGSVGIGFAISAKLASSVVDDLIDDGSITRGWLGVSIQEVSPEIASGLGLKTTQGALVSDITEDSPAEKAGLKPGDTVLAVDDTEIKTTRDLARTIAAVKPGEKAKLKLWRQGAETTVTVKIGTLPGQDRLAAMQKGGSQSPQIEPTSYKALGLEVEPLDGDDGAGGLVVARVRPGSDAAEKGFRRGDRILAVAGVKVKSVEEFEAAIKTAEKDDLSSILVLVRSNNRQRFVSLKLENA
ncbi:HtrA protease/chaperone protein [hydrothermal vent metagenome]|uniref:Probable periplasmic serine endoprotease DegP-like n=1 Tax=hydrothermal vent metagenome TaxID=652676 RepID=A0A3B0U1C0_9ZZZZ